MLKYSTNRLSLFGRFSQTNLVDRSYGTYTGATYYWVSECKNRVTNRDRAMIGWKCRRSQTTKYQLSVQCRGQHKQPWREPTIHWTRRYCPWVDWAMSEDRLTCNDISDNDVMERMCTAHQRGLCTPHDLHTTGPQTHIQTTVLRPSYLCELKPSGKNWRILLQQSFTVHMPFLMATRTFWLGRKGYSSPQCCYLK